MMKIAYVFFFLIHFISELKKAILFPTFSFVYKQYRKSILKRVQNAKYGTYSSMNANNNEIIDCHVAHVAVAGNSVRMEKMDLCTLLEKFRNMGVSLRSLKTERKRQIRSYMAKEQSDITPQFDIWHVGKSIKRPLFRARKLKAREELNRWIRAIMNHFWGSCGSCNEDAVKLKEKWVSILYHIKNIHPWEDDPVFNRYLPLTKTE